jgi:peptidoglycan/LPS O-acetylase OafA/YrhL
VLSKYQNEILPFFNSLGTASLICLFVLAIGMYTYQWNIVWFPVPVFNLLKKAPTDFVACVSALLLIILSMTEKINMTFNNKYLVELGKISFSLYLIHPLIIGVIAIQLGNLLPVYIVVILSVILSLLLAFPFHYWVEWPLQKLGRKLGDRLK